MLSFRNRKRLKTWKFLGLLVKVLPRRGGFLYPTLFKSFSHLPGSFSCLTSLNSELLSSFNHPVFSFPNLASDVLLIMPLLLLSFFQFLYSFSSPCHSPTVINKRWLNYCWNLPTSLPIPTSFTPFSNQLLTPKAKSYCHLSLSLSLSHTHTHTHVFVYTPQ